MMKPQKYEQPKTSQEVTKQIVKRLLDDRECLKMIDSKELKYIEKKIGWESINRRRNRQHYTIVQNRQEYEKSQLKKISHEKLLISCQAINADYQRQLYVLKYMEKLWAQQPEEISEYEKRQDVPIHPRTNNENYQNNSDEELLDQNEKLKKQ